MLSIANINFKLPDFDYEKAFSKFIIKDGKSLYDTKYRTLETEAVMNEHGTDEIDDENDFVKPFTCGPTVDLDGRVVEEDPSANYQKDESEESATFIPFTIEPEAEDVTITFSVSESDNQEEVKGGETVTVDSQTEASVETPSADSESQQVGEAPSNNSELYDNSDIISKYSQLKAIEQAIREVGLDCRFIQRSDSIIAVGVFKNNEFAQDASFMVDLDGSLIGVEEKWFNTFIGPETSAEELEDYIAIRINNLDLIKKYATGVATVDEMKDATIYNARYLAINDIVNLASLPTEKVNDYMREKIVNRLYHAIEAGVFDAYRGKDMDRFEIDKFTSLESFTMKSGNHKIIVTKDTMKTIEEN